MRNRHREPGCALVGRAALALFVAAPSGLAGLGLAAPVGPRLAGPFRIADPAAPVAPALPGPQGVGSSSVLPAPRQVRIVYDAEGVPIVHAQSFAEACYGIGWAHAEARAGQLYKQLYAALGRVSEITGKTHGTQVITNTLFDDKYYRTLDLRDALLQDYQRLPTELRDALRNYAAGVNDFIGSLGGDLPDVMESFGFTPATVKPWEPVDSLLVYAYASNQFLDGAWKKQLQQYADFVCDVAATDYDTAVAFHTYFGGPSTYRGPLDCLAAPVNDLAPAPGGGRPSGIPRRAAPETPGELHRLLKASHGFAVPAPLSGTGTPILVAMPMIKIPASAWIPWGVVTPDMQVRGAGFPGTLALMTGFGRHIAWGVSSAPYNGVQAILIEPDPSDPTRYLLDGQSLPYTTRTETIQVAGQTNPVSLLVEETVFGPIIDLFTPAPVVDVNGQPRRVALTHVITSLHSSNLLHPYVGYLDLYRADSMGAAVDAVARGIHYPSFLTYLIDAQSGQAGFVNAGAVPKLSPNHPDPIDIRLELPGDGRFSQAAWIGFESGLSLPSKKTSSDLIVVGNNLPRCPLQLPGAYPARAGHTERSSTLELELDAIRAANGGRVPLQAARDLTRFCNVTILVQLRQIVNYVINNYPSAVPSGNTSIDMAVATLLNAQIDLRGDNPDLCFLHNAFSKFATAFRTNPLGATQYGYGAAGAARFVRDFIADPAATINPTDLSDIVQLVFVDGLEQAWDTTVQPPDGLNPFKCGPDPLQWINQNVVSISYAKGSYFVTKEGELLNVPIQTGFLPCFHSQSLWSQSGGLYTLVAYPGPNGELIGEERFFPSLSDEPTSPRWDNTRVDWEQGNLKLAARNEAEADARCGGLTEGAEICGFRDLGLPRR